MVSQATKTLIKEKIVEAIINFVVFAIGVLVSWAIYIAFTGKDEIDKKFSDISESLNLRMTNEFNEGVKRDADIMATLEEIRKELEKNAPPGGRPSLPPPSQEPKDYYDKHFKPYEPLPQQMQMPQRGR